MASQPEMESQSGLGRLIRIHIHVRTCHVYIVSLHTDCFCCVYAYREWGSMYVDGFYLYTHTCIYIYIYIYICRYIYVYTYIGT